MTNILSAVLFSTMATAVCAVVIHWGKTAAMARSQVRIGLLAEQIDLGSSRDDVAAALVKAHDSAVTIREDGRFTAVSGPVGFFAQGWVLYITFEGDSVAAIKLRNHDGNHPPGTLPDRVAVTSGEGQPASR
jgi:hypothetical protein